MMRKSEAFRKFGVKITQRYMGGATPSDEHCELVPAWAIFHSFRESCVNDRNMNLCVILSYEPIL